VKLAPAFVASLIVIGACADGPAPPEEGPPDVAGTPFPEVAELVCEADETTRILTPSVVVQADGLHVHVDVLLGEPAQIDGVWPHPRIRPGERDFVSSMPPGSYEIACWPVSKLDSASFEPTRRRIEILDPDDIYVTQELECLPGDETAGWTVDFDEHGPDVEPPITAEQAGTALRRLEPGDRVTHVGYPDRPDDHIAVVRDGRTIAAMLFFHGQDGIESYAGGVCASEAVLPPGIE
jgi:hypothetical protein